jgi:hypothetical protein
MTHKQDTHLSGGIEVQLMLQIGASEFIMHQISNAFFD